MRVVSATLGAVVLVFASACDQVPQSTHAESAAMWQRHETLEALVEASDVIVRARVIDNAEVYSVGSGSARNLPIYFTDTRVAVERLLKGVAPQELLVWQTGRAGDPGNSFADLPILKPGSRVLLFLTNISSDPNHGRGKVKFAIVSPDGLYEIHSDRLVTVALGTNVTNEAAVSTLQAFEARVLTTVR
ncbi:MAG TPA: hypothetical protein VFM06_11895 [Candidatus Limnocylindria bacterium]|nr:hypothetical protein [Candidatus Limnocylindria bacterium]